ncbi:hypothetical protein A2U01_0070098, partial [Trifolium medium]|nr:hypothetical protein [Trifolium medium]
KGIRLGLHSADHDAKCGLYRDITGESTVVALSAYVDAFACNSAIIVVGIPKGGTLRGNENGGI